MPWSGGSYTKGNAATGGWQGDASVGIGIEADRHDTQDDDFTAGINNALAKDGQNTPTANLPMGSYKHTGVGNATNNDEYVALGQLDSISVALDGGNTPTANLPMGGFKHTGVDDATAADQYLSYGQLLDVTKAVTTAGTEPNYTVTLTPAPSAYATGQIFPIRIHTNLTTNAGATLNVNGLGAKALKVAPAGNALRDPVSLELGQRQVHYVAYDGTDDVFRILNPNFGYQWISYTPSVASSAGTLVLNATGNDNWYQFIGPNVVRIHFQCHLNLSGSSAAFLQIGLPFNTNANDNNTFGIGSVEVASGYSQRNLSCFISGSNIRFYRDDLTNFAIDSSFYVYCTMIYNPNY